MSAGVTGTHLSRVFMTADSVGGVWPYALELAAGLAARGIATDLAIVGPLAGARAAAAKAIPGLRMIETGLPLEWTAANPDEVLEASRTIARLAEINQPDIVHLNTPALAACGRFPAPIVAVMHSCVATWWRAVRGGPLPADFAWRTELAARGLASADAVVAVSRSLSAAAKEVYGAQLDVNVVLNGRTAPAPIHVEKERLILTAGRLWDDGKNVAALDRAAGRLDVPVMAAGPVRGPNGTEGRFSRLRLLGNLDESELATWYRRASVFVSAARYEPFGFAVLEAAQAGTALVLSDIPTFRELWDGAAMFVADGEDYAPVLRSLIDSPANLTLWAGRAAHRAQRYSARCMVGGLVDVYRGVLASAVAPAA